VHGHFQTCAKPQDRFYIGRDVGLIEGNRNQLPAFLPLERAAAGCSVNRQTRNPAATLDG
jgi:hypothetical protein